MKAEISKFFHEKPISTPIVAVTGGKGGTGKTTVAVNLAVALKMKGMKVMLVDVDVDGPNDAVLLGVKLENGEDVAFFKPVVNTEKCVKCGKCAEVCLENALVYVKGQFPAFFEELCSGCAACQLVCPAEAIEEGRKILGEVYVSEVDGIKLVTGELKPTEARSPLVALKTKEKAYEIAKKESFDVILVDTAPGVHNPVVRALQGASFALAVTEPTPLGAHDLGRILDLTKQLGLSTNVVLNRADIKGGYKRIIYEICEKSGAEIVSEIPFDKKLLEAYIRSVPVVKLFPSSPSAKAILKLADYVSERLK